MAIALRTETSRSSYSIRLVEQLPILLFAVHPAAVGVAVLRYRLYAIDRVISRTVIYGLVIGLLGALYVAGVVGLGSVVSGLTGQEGSDIAIGASVLVVVTLFQPLRLRVQRAMDRRFDRTGYDARLLVDRFAADLRDEVELEPIHRELTRVTALTVRPERVSAWLSDTRTPTN